MTVESSTIHIYLRELILISLRKLSQFSNTLSDDEWKGLFDSAKSQALLGICFTGIEQLPKNQRPPKSILIQWLVCTEQIERTNCLLNSQAKELTSLFEKGGFESSILKGQGVAQLYPIPQRRQSGDIDIWISDERDKIVKFARTQGQVYSVSLKHAKYKYFNDTEVEIHFIPTWFYNPLNHYKWTKWVKNIKEKKFRFSGIGYSIPTIKFNLVYSMVHIYRHLFDEGIGLRQLMDYYYILIHSKQSERTEAYKILCSLGMKRFVGAVMFVLQEFFRLENEFLLSLPSEKYGRKFLSTIIEGGNFGAFDPNNQHQSETIISRGIRNMKHISKIAFDYPSEVFWSPIWKLWHWCWRKKHRYL